MSFRSVLRRSALAGCVLLSGLLAGCDDNPVEPEVPAALPQVIVECETNTAEVCGVWTRIGSTDRYEAVWSQGSRAVITVVQFDSKAVVFTRGDTEGPSADLVARYVGFMDGDAVEAGLVEWNTGGLTFYGRWTAQW